MTRFGWLVAGGALYVLFCGIGLWLNSRDPEYGRQYHTSINRAAATSLWKWNINSEDAPR